MEGRYLRTVRVMADYQFGEGAGEALFPDTCEFIISPKTGKIRQILDSGVRIATVKPDSGLLSISVEGARRLKEHFPYPRLRVVVDSRVGEFVAKGKNVFAKHVVDVDEGIRANDEVAVVNEEDELLATGKAILSAFEMLELERGVAVSVRQGVKR
ncbi:Prefoldin, molecular chaperone implicated in de novo protein folding, alpha subunit [Geoglobus ahangari]|uniref:Prefoldin, molecular chaperone implicated in de novo protein folding, alpha subunit n=1 Tax=Geoglobus ahangari TaxID=113653 RepID=A0A0F7IDP5_9EURY|nr:PUA domain-containing protein [Geoglobus ahangari]AKG91022.1 Prefoldin, molecular chaperone implicated in de novo protein folding, alpha subunit [Geoglobus ahangari]